MSESFPMEEKASIAPCAVSRPAYGLCIGAPCGRLKHYNRQISPHHNRVWQKLGKQDKD